MDEIQKETKPLISSGHVHKDLNYTTSRNHDDLGRRQTVDIKRRKQNMNVDDIKSDSHGSKAYRKLDSNEEFQNSQDKTNINGSHTKKYRYVLRYCIIKHLL